MDPEYYISDPCGASSLPFWKTNIITPPENVTVVRDDKYSPSAYPGADEPYFKLVQTLKNIDTPVLPAGYAVTYSGFASFASHINECYADIGVTETELREYASRPVYDPSLWIAVAEARTGRVVATGIAELDKNIGEGALEWIQVSPDCRRKGLGAFIVHSLLFELSRKARFVTVSGRLKSESDPVSLYRSCGFGDPVIWHVISKPIDHGDVL